VRIEVRGVQRSVAGSYASTSGLFPPGCSPPPATIVSGRVIHLDDGRRLAVHEAADDPHPVVDQDGDDFLAWRRRVGELLPR